MKKRWMKILFCTIFAALLVPVFAVPAMATGDVAGAIQSTWTAAQTQIRTVVDNVVFPVIDMILAILFFVKVNTDTPCLSHHSGGECHPGPTHRSL